MKCLDFYELESFENKLALKKCALRRCLLSYYEMAIYTLVDRLELSDTF